VLWTRKIPWFHDVSNDSMAFDRVRVRTALRALTANPAGLKHTELLEQRGGEGLELDCVQVALESGLITKAEAERELAARPSGPTLVKPSSNPIPYATLAAAMRRMQDLRNSIDAFIALRLRKLSVTVSALGAVVADVRLLLDDDPRVAAVVLDKLLARVCPRPYPVASHAAELVIRAARHSTEDVPMQRRTLGGCCITPIFASGSPGRVASVLITRETVRMPKAALTPIAAEELGRWSLDHALAPTAKPVVKPVAATAAAAGQDSEEREEAEPSAENGWPWAQLTLKNTETKPGFGKGLRVEARFELFFAAPLLTPLPAWSSQAPVARSGRQSRAAQRAGANNTSDSTEITVKRGARHFVRPLQPQDKPNVIAAALSMAKQASLSAAAEKKLRSDLNALPAWMWESGLPAVVEDRSLPGESLVPASLPIVAVPHMPGLVLSDVAQRSLRAVAGLNLQVGIVEGETRGV
jgi:hypothetical protein